ncbi:adenylyl-sulfate kinase [bacterium]|nr:MAG: adenylyl-sulfate kinase [bacterium]
MKHIVWDGDYADRAIFEDILGQLGALLWFTGLSGSGKSTIAKALQKKLIQCGTYVVVLDGDNIRHGLNSDLDFSESGRKENIRRIAEVAKLFVEHGAIVITAFISPYKSDRNSAREIVGNGLFKEIFINTPIEECIKRDPKGLYKKAISGEILQFTGISDPYEAPDNPELAIQTINLSIEESAEQIVTFLKQNGTIQ